MSRTLTLCVGIPGSGKSSWAERERANRPFEVRIVTRDDIRFALGTRFDQDDEPAVMRIAETMAEEMLRSGYDVIVADTNLSGRVRRRWKHLAQRIANEGPAVVYDERPFPIDLHEAIRRVDDRHSNGGHWVPHGRIQAMHEQMTKYLEETTT